MPPLVSLQATYRCLRDLEMDFRSPVDGEPSPFVAVVGANGAGKTTVLESVVYAVYGPASEWEYPEYGYSTWPPQWKVGLGFQGSSMQCMQRGIEVTPHVATDKLFPKLRATLYIPSGYLPLMLPHKPLAPAPEPRLPGREALSRRPPESRIEHVHQWWLHQHWEYPRTTRLDRLWRALQPFLGDLVYAGVDPKEHLPHFDARGTQVSFNELSSGERRVILLFMEIAMQCGEDGLVLFDEPEAHFHPIWQRMLPAALAELVPQGQVIVATHSPHIVEGLPAHQLFVLGDLPW